MKLTKLIGIVLSLHLGVAGMLLFQPGCQTLQMDEKAEINPVQTLVPEKEEERARILIGEKKDDLPVIQGHDEDNFNSDTIRNRRYLPSRPVEPIIPETPSEVEYVSVVEEVSPDEKSDFFNVDSVELVLPDSSNLEFDLSDNEDAETVSESSREVYFVQKGDSLWKISRTFGTSLSAIMDENGLHNNSVLKIGQKLYLPSSASPSTSKSFVSKVPVSIPSTGDEYIVNRGDSLSKIARMHGVSVSELKTSNSLFTDRINIGQKLKIPGAGSRSSSNESTKSISEPLATGSVYLVQRGDTLGKIAAMYGMKSSELARINNLANPNRLKVGQRLTVSSPNDNFSASSVPSKVSLPVKSKPKPEPIKIEEPMFDMDLDLDLDSKDINDNFFEQDLDIPVVNVIEAE
jgi:LysM repeat protein